MKNYIDKFTIMIRSSENILRKYTLDYQSACSIYKKPSGRGFYRAR
jgi:hypothetical protein